MKVKSLNISILIEIIIILLIFLALAVLSIFYSPLTNTSIGNEIYGGILIVLTILFLIWTYFSKNPQKIIDMFLIIAILFLIWDIITKFSLIDTIILPPPSKVFLFYSKDYFEIGYGILSSLAVLGIGYILAFIIAIPLGLLLSYKKRLYDFAYPLSKGLSPIPPMVYIPYAIILLPSLFLSSVFVIFIGAFWPLLLGVITGVLNIDKITLDSAKTLGLDDYTMIRKILLPGALPHIFSGAFIALIISFITLLMAEVIGSSAGIGWYLQHNAQFGEYGAIIAGMIVISILVIIITTIFDKIQKYSLRWQDI
ncbi:MAG: ABC transporter permease subunit [Methanobrevibacter sp.]|jgi:NitT/TauT family transport system permease protein|nr:ABC transporter permease subunit [Methanobrevibacter sp.]